MITGSKELIRDINSHLILKTIIREEHVSRAALAEKTGLTKATVSAIVADLIERNLVIEIGSENTSLGRKPILLTYNPTCGNVICIDLNHTAISVLISDLKGQNCTLKQYSHEINEKLILSCLEKIITKTLDEISPSPYGIVGITIAIHGTVFENEVTFSPYAPYEGLPFKSYLESKFKIPIYLENEANLSVIAEQAFYYNSSNIIGISIHTGVGVGIIVNNTLYTGFNGNAGEFGHTIVERGGRLCPCGNRGCLEQYASERIILQQFAEESSLSHADISMFMDAYAQNDAIALSLMDDFISYMAIALNNILVTFNPDLMVINSPFTIYNPDILQKIEHRLSNRLRSTCSVVPSILQDTSILLGGACVCIRNFLNIDNLVFGNTTL